MFLYRWKNSLVDISWSPESIGQLCGDNSGSIHVRIEVRRQSIRVQRWNLNYSNRDLDKQIIQVCAYSFSWGERIDLRFRKTGPSLRRLDYRRIDWASRIKPCQWVFSSETRGIGGCERMSTSVLPSKSWLALAALQSHLAWQRGLSTFY